ncbi:unnamed protein product [Alopecurus aequalis]
METIYKKEVTATPEDNTEGRDGSTLKGRHDPRNPSYPLRPHVAGTPVDADAADHNIPVKERMKKTGAILANSRATDIIIPDCTPKRRNYALFDLLRHLEPILENDDVRSFLRFFNKKGEGITWGHIITAETLNQMVVYNAVKCAKVVLVGENPVLRGFRANPNCITQYGFFPLHRAAEFFSVDMIELLVRHGALANLRTTDALVVEDLLPLHVAIENTCLHKYLEDIIYPDQEHLDCSQEDIIYVLKLIHILCLPEMKIFLDTIRMLAKHTDNLLDELCMYITEGKIVQTAVLLLAAQEQIRRVSSRKRDGSSKQDGFFTVINHVLDDIAAIKLQMCQKELEMEPLEKKKSLLNTILMLVRVISKAGEALDYYIRSHEKVPDVTQVPHMEVLARVSLILKDHGFCYTGDGIDIGNLCPYEHVMSSEELPDKFGEMAMIKAGTEVTRLPNGKAKGKKEPRGWALKLARRSFFPCWRSVLTSRFPVKFFPVKELQATLAKASAIRGRNPEVKASYQSRRLFGTVLASQFPAKLCPLKELEATLTKTTGEASIVMGRDPQVKASCQTRRLFGTVASTLLKVLRKA